MKSFIISVICLISIILNAHGQVTVTMDLDKYIGKEYVSKSGFVSSDTRISFHIDGNIEFICIGKGEKYRREYGIFQAKNYTSLIVHSDWRHGKFEKFITRSSYDDLIKKYGKKATVEALKGYYDLGTPLTLFIIARGDPDSWRTTESKYGKTDILIYESLGDYSIYTFKNSKLESTSEGY